MESGQHRWLWFSQVEKQEIVGKARYKVERAPHVYRSKFLALILLPSPGLLFFPTLLVAMAYSLETCRYTFLRNKCGSRFRKRRVPWWRGTTSPNSINLFQTNPIYIPAFFFSHQKLSCYNFERLLKHEFNLLLLPICQYRFPNLSESLALSSSSALSFSFCIPF